MIVRSLAYAAAVAALFAVSPGAWVLLALLPVGAIATALAARGRLRPWSDLASAAVAVAAAVLAGAPPGGLFGLAAVGAIVVLAACVILPSASAPRARAVPAGVAWLCAGAVVALAVWLPAWLATRGSLAPLDPLTGPGLLVRSGAALAALALAVVALGAVRRATRKLGHGEAGAGTAGPGQPPNQV
ncbi:MAG: hypothetical protein LC623_02800 [Halobacteriales archaeon]|nr:hypothetical protein [Halobacteriales archaeon]